MKPYIFKLPVPSPPARLEGLTGLRAVAAVAVVLFHLNEVVFPSLDLPKYLPFVDHYYLGVDLFFLLSGFILAHVHGCDFAHSTLEGTLRFYGLRLARIYPVHFTMLVAFVALYFAQRTVGPALGIELHAPADHYTLGAFLQHLFLVQASGLTWNFPAWSISAEWFAYLWFPLLAVVLLRRSPRASLVLLSALVLGYVLVFVTVFEDSLDQQGLVRVSFEFTAGVLLYRITFASPDRILRACCLAILGLAALLAATRYLDFAAVLVAAASIVLVARAGTRAPRWLMSRPLMRLGEISYSLYMCQALVMAIVGRVVEPALPHLPTLAQFALVPAVLGIMISAAALLHDKVELPARMRLRRLLRATGRTVRIRLPGRRPAVATEELRDSRVQ